LHLLYLFFLKKISKNFIFNIDNLHNNKLFFEDNY